MVKTPRTRHSKSQRTPVTIDLTANETPEAVADPIVVKTEEPAGRSDDGLLDGGTPVETAADDAPLEQPVEDRLEEDAALKGRQEPYEPRPAAAAPPAQTPAPKSAGWGSHIAAGVIGGLLAAGSAWFLQPGQGAPDTSLTDSLRAEIAGLQSEINGLKSAGGNGDLTALVEQLRGEISALQASVQASGGDEGAVSALNDKIAQLESAIASLSANSGSATQLETRIAAVEQSVANLVGKIETQTAQPKIALSIAAAALKSALDRGTPFTAELETFAAIAPGLPQIEALRAPAASGVATRADIAKVFPAAADAMVAAAQPVDAEAGFFQRLLNSAESVVQVRPVGEVAGDEPGARVARMEVAVNAGDFAKALAEYDALPDAVKAAGASVADQIKARASVEQLADQMIADAMKAA